MKHLLEIAYTLGFEYEKKYKGCAQCTIAAIQDSLNIREDGLFKAATGLAGGGGLTGIGTCGGYSGTVMMISWLCGRERSNFADPDRTRIKNFQLIQKFTDQYLKTMGSIICRDIQTLRFGRPYYIADPEDFEKFERAGAHIDKCPGIIGEASRLAVKFFIEERLADLPESEYVDALKNISV